MISEYNVICKRMHDIAIIPVIKLGSSEQALPLAKALCAGGLEAAEITFRSDAATESIALIREHYPAMLCGAGTVLTTKQVDAAIHAGAQFIVSPGFNPRIVDYCIEKDIAVFPGVNNPSGIELALERGLNVLKFFPAEASGGIAMVKAMSAPYGDVKFMATGGINTGNLIDYLNCKPIIACGGSWMVKSELFESGSYSEVETLSRQAVDLIKTWRAS